MTIHFAMVPHPDPFAREPLCLTDEGRVFFDVLLAAKEGFTRRAILDEGYTQSELAWEEHWYEKRWTLVRVADRDADRYALASVWVVSRGYVMYARWAWGREEYERVRAFDKAAGNTLWPPGFDERLEG